MRKLSLIFLGIILIQLVFAQCSEGQVDINLATLNELDKITYVGPVTAENIINSRPFSVIEDLIYVTGIGDVKLQAIKNEGLACVSGKETNEEIQIEEEKDKPKEVLKETEKKFLTKEIIEEKVNKPEMINLSPQNIKREENIESNKDYTTYGLIFFCMLIGLLWFIKLKKEKYKKNEFRN